MSAPIRFLLFVSAAIVAACFMAAAAHAQPDPSGFWIGAIEVPGSALAIEVELTPAKDSWAGTISIPSQGTENSPLSAVEVVASDDSDNRLQVRFAIAGVPGNPSFDGHLEPDGRRIAGRFTQSGGELSFFLERMEREEGPDPATLLVELPTIAGRAVASLDTPGVAIAVWANGKEVFAQGFGQRDLESGLPMTADTIGPVGSTTKAFTALLMGMLVDEGKVDLDQPVRNYLPDFQLFDEIATERMTVRDLLTHRSGLPRHDLSWYGAPETRQELFSRLRYLEPSADLREEFQYQNLMYLTAGILIEKVSGKTWEELIQSRLFAPLGMQRSSVDLEGMWADPNHAKGTTWREESGLQTVPHRIVGPMAPAGAINSSVREMLQWARFQLGDGSIGDQRLVQAATLHSSHSPQIVVSGLGGAYGLVDAGMSPYSLYALGWIVRPYRGHQVIHHGGGIDGFIAEVAFVPDSGIAVAVIANSGSTIAPFALTLTVIDRLLELEEVDWVGKAAVIAHQAREAAASGVDEPRQNTRPAHDLAEYPGEYHHPGYGTIEVRREGVGESEGLAMEFHSFDSPLSHFHFETFRAEGPILDGMKLSFHTDVQGEVRAVSMRLEPALDPIRFERRGSSLSLTVEELARYVGRYQVAGEVLTLRIRDGELIAEVPGQPTHVLEPLRPGLFTPRGLDGYSIRFEPTEGEVSRAILSQPNGSFAAEKIKE